MSRTGLALLRGVYGLNGTYCEAGLGWSFLNLVSGMKNKNEGGERPSRVSVPK